MVWELKPGDLNKSDIKQLDLHHAFNIGMLCKSFHGGIIQQKMHHGQEENSRMPG